jgi:hypothetical protein
VHKYREGKMQRTLERELKVPETVVGEADGLAVLWCEVHLTNGGGSQRVNSSCGCHTLGVRSQRSGHSSY